VLICNDCGHQVVGRDPEGNPVCAVCVGISGDGRNIKEVPLNSISGLWTCTYCGKRSERPRMIDNIDKRLHYCGCRGWD
jgi:hypothetical protein